MLAEAMGLGLPPVCTRIRGAVDHLVSGCNALFVEAHQPSDVRDKLMRLRDDSELRDEMSRANLELVKRFAPNVVAATYRRAIEDVVESRV